MSTMTPGERVRAAVKGEAVDRVPLVFWHHFKPEGSGEKLAEFTINFFVDTFKLDIAKSCPIFLILGQMRMSSMSHIYGSCLNLTSMCPHFASNLSAFAACGSA